MYWYNVLTVILSYIVLAAHFLRPGNIFMAVVSLGIPFLLLIKRRPTLRIVQGGLLLGVLIWLTTLAEFVQKYTAAGRDITRMVIIILSVAVFTLITALLLNRKKVVENYIK